MIKYFILYFLFFTLFYQFNAKTSLKASFIDNNLVSDPIVSIKINLINF